MYRQIIIVVFAITSCTGTTDADVPSNAPLLTDSPPPAVTSTSTFSATASPGSSSPTSAPSPEASLPARPHLGITEGCKASFWANPDSFELWEEHGPDDVVGLFFPDPADFAQLALADALLPPSGDDFRRTLIRQAVAAILNAAHDSLEYPYSRYEPGVDDRPAIVPTVAELLRTGAESEMTDFARDLAAANELGCPL